MDPNRKSQLCRKSESKETAKTFKFVLKKLYFCLSKTIMCFVLIV